MRYYIGIDPGVSGAVAVLDSERRPLIVEDMPTSARGKTRTHNVIDAPGLSEMLRPYWSEYSFAVLEQVSAMPGQGVSSVFSLGESLGTIRGVLGAFGIPVELVSPQKWKKHYGLTSDKELCRARAIDLFPGESLHRKKDHGRAEALLMALYGASIRMKYD